MRSLKGAQGAACVLMGSDGETRRSNVLRCDEDAIWVDMRYTRYSALLKGLEEDLSAVLLVIEVISTLFQPGIPQINWKLLNFWRLVGTEMRERETGRDRLALSTRQIVRAFLHRKVLHVRIGEPFNADLEPNFPRDIPPPFPQSSGLRVFYIAVGVSLFSGQLENWTHLSHARIELRVPIYLAMSSILSSSSTIASATSTYTNSIPTGTISALIGQPPNTTNDYYIVAYLLTAFGQKTSPLKGIVIPPLAPTNYVYESRANSILVGMSVCIFFMFTFTLIRLLIRLLNRGLKLGLDDLFIVPGVILAITWPVLQILAVVYGGAGKHIWDVTYEEYGYFKRYTNLSKIFFFVAVGVVKVSICLFNRRLTSMTSRNWLMFNNVFLFLLVVYIMVSLFWNIFSCSPAWGGWDAVRLGRENVVAVCFPVGTSGSILSTIHVVMDFGLLAVPFVVLWKVKMGWGTRGRLYVVFAVGGVSMIGSILRQIAQTKLSSDVLWSFKSLEDWTLVDLTLGVIAASLPVLSAIIPAKWKSIHTSSYKNPSHLGSYPLSKPGHFRRSKMPRMSGKERGKGTKIKGTIGTFGESEENIVRTDVIELSFQSKIDLERGEGEREEEGEREGERSANGNGGRSESRSGSASASTMDTEGSSDGKESNGKGKITRSFSRNKNRSRGDSAERGVRLDKGTEEWHGGKGQYGHRVEIGRHE
ncbi:hypothetical protein SBOR_1843 [Sclerotinia borealis F-4128]|uniref:Rhodopsin domain-containing protein n=1 Tax=Sclerotinia borealis (strain F-4128) TaxID=1432307 RepID=W9CPH7_SCLBF|nr:hypothetical protein SBOR_1843 [Sclerotinia borealis F-4128]